MGLSPCSNDEAIAILNRLSVAWDGPGYDLTRRNCCHFAKALCEELRVAVEFPAWINRLAGAGAAIGDAHTAVLVQAQQIDEEYRLSEGAQGYLEAAMAKVAEIDGEYKISDKANQLDEAYKVSETAAAAATAASDAIGAAAGAVFGNSEAPSMASMTEAAKAPTTDASESAQPDQ